ncbi:tetratricopeptide repeat protein [Wenyingzhuangia sp. 1_MG-2023]|nr:tetratricopeptide repeat protein [Wenyingzhuangia sp. 1_MG-2023]
MMGAIGYLVLGSDMVGSINLYAKNENIRGRDTLQLVDFYLKTADENKNNGLYAMAYEDLWEAMLLASAVDNIEKLAVIYNELGVLYGIYGKSKKAIEYKKIALQYVKKSLVSNKENSQSLGKAYYSLAVQYRKAKEYKQSLMYLDSCFYGNKNKNPYVLAEKGIVYTYQNRLKEAEVCLLAAKQLLEKESKHYLVIVYSSLGDLYVEKKQLEKAIYYYNKSLNRITVYKSHTDLQTDVLRKIGNLYRQKNELKKAYACLKQSTQIADSLFSMRSKNNTQLFEIKNKYKERLIKKEAYISQQEHVIEKKKRIFSQLLFVIAIVFFAFLAVLFLFYHKAKVRRVKEEQEHKGIKIKHEKEKLDVILETKSKELTVSTLQLIEKDKNINRLLEILKKKMPDSYRKLHREMMNGSNDLWERFNLRFTEVNAGFYERLSEKYPLLTPTEQKHCALIKLKFDSKEMASLLNISVNSVHISRHRIRKKMELQRDDDLSNYIANI